MSLHNPKQIPGLQPFHIRSQPNSQPMVYFDTQDTGPAFTVTQWRSVAPSRPLFTASRTSRLHFALPLMRARSTTR